MRNDRLSTKAETTSRLAAVRLSSVDLVDETLHGFSFR
jgi:hypothetical protein